jgi:Flp pilus assembly protein TadG
MRALHSDAGQTAAEFAMLFPFMMLLLLFFVEFGFVLHNWVTVNNAAAEAARYAAVGNLPNTVPGTCPTATPLSIESRARQASGNQVLCNEVVVGYHKFAGTNVERGDGVSVRISHVYQTVTGLGNVLHLVTGGVLPTTLTMSSCADARMEIRPTVQPLPNQPDCG